MNSLRELMRVSAQPSSLRDWAAQRKVQRTSPLSLRQIMAALAPPELWGFADLHAHPAANWAFGADSNTGEDGLIWGKPGLNLETSSIATDLGSCDIFQHCGYEGDLVRHDVKGRIVKMTEKIIPHLADGSPSFRGWPHASSLTHQQMHISMIYRAWQGGLRLMVACAVDNQLISTMWNRGVDLSPKWPYPDPNFDLESARRQLRFIRSQADANRDWMRVVTTSAEARNAVSNDKLAVILGVEMDALTAEQIIQLKEEFGIRQVVPIHLANNSFGGVAVYDNNFNTNNWYLQGGHSDDANGDHQCNLFFHVEKVNYLTFKLDIPQYLRMETSKWIPDGPGALIPEKITQADFESNDYLNLGYLPPTGQVYPNPQPYNPEIPYAKPVIIPYKPPTIDDPSSKPPGNRNQLGLNPEKLYALMKAGLLIDLAHMSEKSQTDAISLSEKYGYPFMDSHTGIRPDLLADGQSASERDISQSLVGRLTKIGGVIGLGTSGERYQYGGPKINVDQIQSWIDRYWDAWVAMNYRGVALGTDTNGLSPQIPNSSSHVEYKFKVGGNPSRPAITELDQCVIGNRAFDFHEDGLAHYGMLADFIEALRRYDDRGADIADYLLCRTAEDTIKMWEMVEQAAARIP